LYNQGIQTRQQSKQGNEIMTIQRVQMMIQYGATKPEGISQARWNAMVAQATRQG
jgi:hypothetical protein